MATARFYVKERNPEGASFPGVPLADIDESDWETYPKWLQDSVDSSDMYRKTRPETHRAIPRLAKHDEETH